MKVIDEIARGGFGRVQKIEGRNGQILARKIFDPQPEILATTPIDKLLRRFEREIRIQSNLHSDYIVPILDGKITETEAWFIMPLAERNFAVEIESHRADSKPLINGLADILNGLEELHSLGYAHRDLKPQNILLLNGKWCLSDFGLVLPPRDSTTTLTSTSSIWGSELYCAPEQRLKFKYVDHHADIYSFGSILHDIFGEGSANRIPYQRQTAEGAIGTIIEKCTEIDPKRRFKNVVGLRGALFTLLTQPHAIKASPTQFQWLDELKSIQEWDAAKAAAFYSYLCKSTPGEDLSPIFVVVDEDILESLLSIEAESWPFLALRYCDWASGAFDFNYCDVIVKRLEKIYEIGNIECKAAAVLATAHLGYANNRYFVMRRLLHMAGPTMDSKLAQRIAIEILATNAKNHFECCAQGISRTIDSFHPLIAAIFKTK